MSNTQGYDDSQTTSRSVYHVALKELDTEEVPGANSNPRIDEYLATVGLSGDETPWCAAFVGWCLEQAGYRGTGAANARSYLNYGVEVKERSLVKGDIVVLKRGSSSWQGHVAFFAGFVTTDSGARRIRLLGGNQKDSVSFSDYKLDDVLAYRRPKEVADSTTVAAATGAVATKGAEQSVDYLSTIYTESGKVADLLPMFSNDTLKSLLAMVSALLVVYVVFERIRRLNKTGV